MKLIVAVDKNYGIGRDNDLLFNIPEDMKFFRETTKGKTVIMGRKTLESLPGGKPLKGRNNIVLSSSTELQIEGATVTDFNGLAKVLFGIPTDDIFVIGGEAVYNLLYPYCSIALITIIEADGAAHKFLQNFDLLQNWQCIKTSEPKTHEGLTFRFCEYQNNSPKTL